MAEPLSKSLRPASFRGVPFGVDAGDIEAGRRTQVHEYPQRDQPWVEDLGRATRTISITAFVVGADYVNQANALLGAAEQAGPGTLVHPWLGSMQVTLKDPARVSFDNGLGVARISLSFVEAGTLEFPSADAATPVQSQQAAGALEDASQASLEATYSVDGEPDFVQASALDTLAAEFADFKTMVGQVGQDVLGYAATAGQYLALAQGFISDPRQLGQAVLGFLGLSSLANGVQRWTNIVRAVTHLADNKRSQRATSNGYTTPTRFTVVTNTQALQSHMRCVLLAQAVGASSLVGSKRDGATNPAYDDLVNLRNTLVAALDAEALLPSTSDTVYTALVNARAAVWQDLTTRSRDNARLASVTPPETVPAVVLAYNLYQDAARDLEIVGRNRLRHPGFVPPTPLKVLTR